MVGTKTPPHCVCNYGDNRNNCPHCKTYCWANLVVDDTGPLSCEDIKSQDIHGNFYWLDTDPNDSKKKIAVPCDNSVGKTGMTCYTKSTEGPGGVTIGTCVTRSTPGPQSSFGEPDKCLFCTKTGSGPEQGDKCAADEGDCVTGYNGADCRDCVGDGRMKEDPPNSENWVPDPRTMPPAMCPWTPSPSPQ